MHRLGLYYQDKHPHYQDKHPLPCLLDMAEYAEEKGFTEIWPADTRPTGDCIAVMSALLVRTDRIRIGSGVLPVWTRNPAVIAATWSTTGRRWRDSSTPGDVSHRLSADGRRWIGRRRLRRVESVTGSSARCSSRHPMRIRARVTSFARGAAPAVTANSGHDAGHQR